jgi:hypothetical protein
MNPRRENPKIYNVDDQKARFHNLLLRDLELADAILSHTNINKSIDLLIENRKELHYYLSPFPLFDGDVYIKSLLMAFEIAHSEKHLFIIGSQGIGKKTITRLIANINAHSHTDKSNYPLPVRVHFNNHSDPKLLDALKSLLAPSMPSHDAGVNMQIIEADSKNTIYIEDAMELKPDILQLILNLGQQYNTHFKVVKGEHHSGYRLVFSTLDLSSANQESTHADLSKLIRTTVDSCILRLPDIFEMKRLDILCIQSAIEDTFLEKIKVSELKAKINHLTSDGNSLLQQAQSCSSFSDIQRFMRRYLGLDNFVAPSPILSEKAKLYQRIAAEGIYDPVLRTVCKTNLSLPPPLSFSAMDIPKSLRDEWFMFFQKIGESLTMPQKIKILEWELHLQGTGWKVQDKMELLDIQGANKENYSRYIPEELKKPRGKRAKKN